MFLLGTGNFSTFWMCIYFHFNVHFMEVGFQREMWCLYLLINTDKYWNDIAFADWMLFSETAWLLLLRTLWHPIIFFTFMYLTILSCGPLSSSCSSKITRSVNMLSFFSWFNARCFEKPCMVVVRLLLRNMNIFEFYFSFIFWSQLKWWIMKQLKICCAKKLWVFLTSGLLLEDKSRKYCWVFRKGEAQD